MFTKPSTYKNIPLFIIIMILENDYKRQIDILQAGVEVEKRVRGEEWTPFSEKVKNI